MERWKFGVGQTAREEAKEIKNAVAAGRADDYLRGQTGSRLVEAETARRRARHPKRQRPLPRAQQALMQVLPGFHRSTAPPL